MWVDLENIEASEISQRKTDSVRSYLYIESKAQTKQAENRLIDTENKRMVTRWAEGEKVHEIGERD